MKELPKCFTDGEDQTAFLTRGCVPLARSALRRKSDLGEVQRMSRRSMMRQPLIANSHRGACLYVKMYTRWIAQDHRGSRQPGRAEVEAVVGFDGRMRIPNGTAYHQRCPSPAGTSG